MDSLPFQHPFLANVTSMKPVIELLSEAKAEVEVEEKDIDESDITVSFDYTSGTLVTVHGWRTHFLLLLFQDRESEDSSLVVPDDINVDDISISSSYGEGGDTPRVSSPGFRSKFKVFSLPGSSNIMSVIS